MNLKMPPPGELRAKGTNHSDTENSKNGPTLSRQTVQFDKQRPASLSAPETSRGGARWSLRPSPEVNGWLHQTCEVIGLKSHLPQRKKWRREARTSPVGADVIHIRLSSSSSSSSPTFPPAPSPQGTRTVHPLLSSLLPFRLPSSPFLLCRFVLFFLTAVSHSVAPSSHPHLLSIMHIYGPHNRI